MANFKHFGMIQFLPSKPFAGLFTQFQGQALRSRLPVHHAQTRADRQGDGLAVAGEDLIRFGGRAIHVCRTVERQGQEAGHGSAGRNKSMPGRRKAGGAG